MNPELEKGLTILVGLLIGLILAFVVGVPILFLTISVIYLRDPVLIAALVAILVAITYPLWRRLLPHSSA
jgi:tetrahydromethanopterin S-methyltransferase subunit C